MQKIPIILVTGFLGSGKTTLIKEYLQSNKGRKIAVLINEIGDVSVDAKILQGYSFQAYELNDGCICCSVNENFKEAIEELATTYAPELIIVETTGVANPVSIVYSITDERFFIDVIIGVVDGLNIDIVKGEDVFTEQVYASDVLIITKVETNASLRSQLLAINPHAKQFLKSEIELDVLFNSLHVWKNERTLDSHKTAHPHTHHHSLNHSLNIETFTIIPPSVTFQAIDTIVQTFPQNLWRVKGVVHLQDINKNILFNFAYGRYSVEKETDEEPFLVFIGKNILEEKKYILSKFK